MIPYKWLVFGNQIGPPVKHLNGILYSKINLSLVGLFHSNITKMSENIKPETTQNTKSFWKSHF